MRHQEECLYFSPARIVILRGGRQLCRQCGAVRCDSGMMDGPLSVDSG